MPLPLSATTTAMASVPSRRVAMMILRSGLSIACAALVTRFSSTWFTCEGEQVMEGMSPKLRSTVTLRNCGLAMRRVATMPSFTLKLATLLRSRREKFLRFTTSSEISSMPCRPSLVSDSMSPSTWWSRSCARREFTATKDCCRAAGSADSDCSSSMRRSDCATASCSSGSRSRTVATLFFT